MSKKRNGRIKDQTIDKFLIPASTIERMNKLNYKTHKTGKEQGMALCLNKNTGRVVPGNESEGDEISIFVPETCKDKKNEKYIGSWHSHPRPSETAFSAMDLFSSCDKRSKIDCVGINRKGEIVCFVKKKNESCQKDAESLVKIENMYGEFDEEYNGEIPDAVLSTVDKLVDRKFISKKIL